MKVLLSNLGAAIQTALPKKDFLITFNTVFYCLGLACLANLMAYSSLTHAEGPTENTTPAITIESLEHFQKDGQLFIDSHILFALPEKVITAIDHEIPISFKTEILLNEQQTFLSIDFDRNRQAIIYHTRLYAYGVNRLYLLHNSRNDKRQAFPTISSALQTLGTLQAFPIIELAELHPEQSYNLKMRISLDRWALPSPLLIDSLVDDEWQITSDWFEIKIQTPKSWM